MEEKSVKDVARQEKMTESYQTLMETLGLSRQVIEYVISEVNEDGERETYIIEQVRK